MDYSNIRKHLVNFVWISKYFSWISSVHQSVPNGSLEQTAFSFGLASAPLSPRNCWILNGVNIFEFDKTANTPRSVLQQQLDLWAHRDSFQSNCSFAMRGHAQIDIVHLQQHIALHNHHCLFDTWKALYLPNVSIQISSAPRHNQTDVDGLAVFTSNDVEAEAMLAFTQCHPNLEF